MGAELQAAMGGMNPFGGGMGRPMAPPPGFYNMSGPGAGKTTKGAKNKKDKRKQAAKARKANRKKRKKK